MGHLHFGDDEDEDMDDSPQPSTSAAQPPAVASGGGPVRLPRCCGSVRVDSNFSDPSYVFRVQHSESTGVIAASVSDNTIKLYQVAGEQLAPVGELKGHTGTITDMAFDSTAGQPHSVLSSSADGTVRAWDTRTGQQAEKYQVRGQEMLSFSTCGHMVAAGTSGEVLFWDRRTGKVLAKLDDTHMDDVTQVRFHGSGRIVSGSTDGLIAVHDVSASFDDDDVFQAALNVNTSVEEIGLFGGQQERLWVRTGTEGVHFWDWLRATDEAAEGGDVPFAEFPQAREAAGRALAASGVAGLFPEVDYVVGCTYDAASGQVYMVAGHNDGAVAFLPIIGCGPSGSGAAALLGPPTTALAGGHTSIVRTASCFGAGGGGAPFCVTGGEDGLVCLWAMGGEAAAGQHAQQLPGPPPLPMGMFVEAGDEGRGASPGPHRQHHGALRGAKDPKRRPSPY